MLLINGEAIVSGSSLGVGVVVVAEGAYDHEGHVKMPKVGMFCFSLWCMYIFHLMWQGIYDLLYE
jgi:hypothetical protein